MQAASFTQDFQARPQIKMIGIAQDDLRTQVLHLFIGHSLDCATRANRHENRRLHIAMSRMQHATTGSAMAILLGYLKYWHI